MWIFFNCVYVSAGSVGRSIDRLVTASGRLLNGFVIQQRLFHRCCCRRGLCVHFGTNMCAVSIECGRIVLDSVQFWCHSLFFSWIFPINYGNHTSDFELIIRMHLAFSYSRTQTLVFSFFSLMIRGILSSMTRHKYTKFTEFMLSLLPNHKLVFTHLFRVCLSHSPPVSASPSIQND